MFYTVYKTTNLVNGKIYVGKHMTADLEADTYIGSGNLLKDAVAKYGRENFQRVFTHVFDSEDEMNAKEAEIVTEEFCSREDTYNVCPGGQGGWGYVNSSEHSLEWKSLGGRLSPNTSKAWSDGKLEHMRPILASNFKGRHHTEKSKRQMGEKISQKASGSGNSQFGTMWITDGVQSRKIDRSETIPEGWNKGRKMGRVLGHS